MHVNIVTLFPELFAAFLATSFVGRAVKGGQLRVHLEPLRLHGLGKHRSVDDTPYGGGSGMVLRVDCVVAALEAAEGRDQTFHRVLLTPQGARLEQSTLRRLSTTERLTLVCGRYEGFDERVRHFVDEEVSLGDFVLTGGEVPAMAILEGCVRLIPGVLGNESSTSIESFSDMQDGLLEYPQYTRPLDFRGLGVPEVLRSGDHGKIREWREQQACERTRVRRPDLFARYDEKRKSP